MRKIPFAGIELTSQRVRGLRGTSELPGLGGFLPGIMLFDPMLLPSGNPLKCHEEVSYMQISPKRFDIFSPDGGMLKKV